MNIPNVSSSSALSTLKAHRNALEGLLPSQGATQLQRNLGPRLRDLARVMTSPYAALDPAHPRERDFQRLLWLQANTSGLIVLLLNATVRTVALDDEGSTAVILVTCINLILASGIQNRHFRPRRGMEDLEIIKKVAAVVVPTTKTSWTKLIESVHSIRPLLSESIDRIEALVEFVCNATEFVEGEKSEDSTGTEITGAIDTL
ncbi:hypothetical protein FRC04_002943 [Tulasnella sp. 424]|nr:hypothetical protein FRC04_002943 [Tulasnella sp. 424]